MSVQPFSNIYLPASMHQEVARAPPRVSLDELERWARLRPTARRELCQALQEPCAGSEKARR